MEIETKTNKRRTCRYRAGFALLVVGALLLGLATATPRAQADLPESGVGDLVKAFGGTWVVDHFAAKINRAINSALRQHQAPVEGATKVVPIIRVGPHGGGAAIGAAQVAGPAAQVQQVEAVAEVAMRITGTVHARGLVPISSRDASTIKGIAGVGVSANIKFPR